MNVLKALATALALSTIVLFVVGFAVGLDDAVNVGKQADITLLGVAFGFHMLAMIAITVRWSAIVRKAKIRISLWRLFLISLSGMAVSNITPSARMGGEPLRAYLLNKETRASTRQSLATIITDRLFDGVAFTVMAFFIVLLASAELTLPQWITAALIIAFVISITLIFAMFFVSFNSKAAIRLSRWGIRKFGFLLNKFKSFKNIEQRIASESRIYSENAKKLMKDQQLWMLGVVLTILIWAFDTLRTYFIFAALGVHVPFLVILAVIIIAALMGAIPATPGGIGLMESAMIIIYSSSGITLAVAGMSTILDRLISFWIFTFIGLAAAYYLNAKFNGGKK
ncbi:MAG: flippase-like domain-containing protein [archaeon]